MQDEKSQLNLRMPSAVLGEINTASSREGKSTSDYLRIAGVIAACHTFREIPLTVFVAASEPVTLERCRALGMTPVADLNGEWQGEVRVQIGKNGLFHDHAGGIWQVTTEGLKQVMGFDPSEEAERLAVFSKLRKLESRSPYKVIREFIAYRLQSEEGYARDEHVMRQGSILFADTEYWKGRQWEGEEVVQFYCGTTRYYIDRMTFLGLTRRTVLHGQ